MAEDPMPISWDSALEARSSSGPTRALLPRSGAMEKAQAFLRDEGRPDVPVSAVKGQ